MQSSAFSLSHTFPTPNPHKLSHPSLHRFNPLISKSVTFHPLVTSSSSCRRFPSFSCSASPRLNGWISTPEPVQQRQSDGVQVRAADSISESADDEASKSKFKDTLVLGSLFGLWYLFNIYFNIYNKQISTSWGVGLVIGPAIGGYFAQPAENYPNIFFEKSLLKDGIKDFCAKINTKVQENMAWLLKKLGEANPYMK